MKENKVKDTGFQTKLENKLGSGGASSIALALELQPSILIIDEAKGRKIAKTNFIIPARSSRPYRFF